MLKRLNTQRVRQFEAKRVNVLQAQAGATERVRGGRWHKARELVFQRDRYTCRCCGRVGGALECDHIIPLEQGGNALGMENLQTLCRDCHAAKTASEASGRAVAYGRQAVAGGGVKVDERT